ncbi:MAG TPA: NUDIX hydrolase [Bacillota bacterium]|nr:NUDIX hydrolase [Bacillota bacterium]
MDISVPIGDAGRFNYRIAVVIVHNGRVLLHKPVDDSYWALPGGRAQLMEHSGDVAVREVWEELQVDIQVERLLWITENFFTYAQEAFHELGLYYKAALSDTSQISLHDGVFYGKEGERDLLYQWIPIEKLSDMTIKPPFLQKGLQQLPESIQHITIDD